MFQPEMKEWLSFVQFIFKVFNYAELRQTVQGIRLLYWKYPTLLRQVSLEM